MRTPPRARVRAGLRPEKGEGEGEGEGEADGGGAGSGGGAVGGLARRGLGASSPVATRWGGSGSGSGSAAGPRRPPGLWETVTERGGSFQPAASPKTCTNRYPCVTKGLAHKYHRFGYCSNTKGARRENLLVLTLSGQERGSSCVVLRILRKPSSNRGCLRGECTRRTQAPTLPASTAVFVPVPPPSLCPPPAQALPLLPGALQPQFPPRFPPGQPPSARYTDSPPGYPPAPANTSSAWVSTAVPMAHADPIPMTQAPPLSGEEFYREHQRLKEEEKKKSKLDEFTNAFAKELMEYKKMQKECRRSFARSKSPCGVSSYSRSSYTYSKSRLGFSHSCSYSRSFSRSHSRSYS
ncbi:uncharacterized protein FN964_013486 [Alca torda]